MPHRCVLRVTVCQDIDFGAGMGRTNERIGRIQETYVANATTSWLESLERSLAQMKEYQVSLAWTCKDLSDRLSLLGRSWRAVDWLTMPP